MTTFPPGHTSDDGPMNRYEELLADEVLWGLDRAECLELESLAAEPGLHARERHTLEWTGAAVAASMATSLQESPPAEVRARMEAMALHFLASEKGLTLAEVARARRPDRTSEPVRITRSAGKDDVRSRSTAVDRSNAREADSDGRGSRKAAGTERATFQQGRTQQARSQQAKAALTGSESGLRRRLLWTQVLAAASLLIAIALFVTRDTGRVRSSTDGVALYSELVEGRTQSRLVRYEWTMPGGAESPEGEVVWDPERQRGVMTFRGLAPVDDRNALQLWIFDGERDKAHPVDGGVFDPMRDGTRAADGTIYVPINAKLSVSEAFAFAVTKEPRQGVVVSDRERIVSLAGQIERL